MKKIATILFVALFVFLPLNAFAATEETTPKTIKVWDTDEYTFAFNLTEDYQSVKSTYVQGEEVYDEDIGEYYDTTVPGRKFFNITAEKSGYYAIFYENSEVDVNFKVYKADDEEIEGIFKESIAILDENNRECGIIFKMKEDEKEYAFAEEYNIGKYSVKYAYFGDDIVSAEATGPLVYDLEVGIVEDYEDDQCINVAEMYPNVNLKFSSGDTAKFCAFVHTKDLRKTGTIKAEITALDKKFEIEITYAKLEDFVESITLPEGFTPACTMSYNGVITYYNYPDYILVKPKGNEEIKAKRGDQITLSNGKSYDVWIEYTTKSEGELVETVSFTYALNGLGNSEIKVTPDCKTVFATFGDIFKDSKTDFKSGINILQGKGGDWTRKDGFYFLGGFFHHTIGAVRYYTFYGEYLQAAAMIAISVLPLILLITVIIIAKKKHKKKKAH